MDSKSEISAPKKRGPGKSKGAPKTGGRQKGTPNKNKNTLLAALDQAGFNVIEEWKQLFDKLDDTQKYAEICRLFPYMFPQLKEVEKLPQEPAEKKRLDTAQLINLAKNK